ncbi:ICOS ligand-like [Melanotaenia boesemani]|uniref:ICOS ligand-like n=1 Tax=Melanotaenia boesemani TaxID=1250792 RepID=UPI001C054DD8|nr:ICOS ligand-like [Melanotaenia boesemani]
MPVALWRAGLLHCLLCVCACLESDCVLGVVGRPVALPCFYPHLPISPNFSIEWRNDDAVVLRSTWVKDGHVEIWSVNYATLSPDAALTGNFSLELPAVHPKKDGAFYSLFIVSGENQSAPMCTVCLRIAASFSIPPVKKDDTAEGDETTFLCHSSGGHPQPAVYWLINNTKEPPERSASLPDSNLYNISRHLTANISKNAAVRCTITNLSTNEILISASGTNDVDKVSRASGAMWLFSTALCVVVAFMVIAAVAYQIHLDRLHKRRSKEFKQTERGYKRRRQYQLETEVMNLETNETEV